ncbi:MAG: HD domain-containing protein [Candidatus Woesearchaeota archaeon]
MEQLIQQLLVEADKRIKKDDPSHDLDHASRVLSNSRHISSYEGGDLTIITPAALFHDVVTYPKDDPRSRKAAYESSLVAGEILSNMDYPREKIPLVMRAIVEHSYSAGIRPETLESKIVQDADRLECTGAIAIMRLFCSTGQMKRKFYDFEDPFCELRYPTGDKCALDFLYKRLLTIGDSMNTETAKRIAKSRTKFLYCFLEQLKDELAIIK